ncbi:SDR family NAD(P)-dependent oxidoreductase [Nocardia nova]|uniref:SDR family NAD(P)-dependent oxidoreductase n=1 Tax=Nocardia nova TaxID=37330 RepID=UPI0033DE0037
MNDFDGMVCVVTAGGAGIGRAHARQLAARGATVHVVDLDGAAAEETAAGIGRNARAHSADVTDPGRISEIAAAVVRGDGRIDTWTNTVGYFKPTSTLAELTVEHWRRSMEINLFGTFVCAKAAAETMMAQGTGSIINVASGAGLRARVPIDYSTAKAAVIHLSRSLALQLAGTGVRVNSVAPGYTKTQMTGFLTEDAAALAAFVERVPVRRLAEPDEIANVLTFIHSPAASFMTGSVVGADGGSSLI